MDRLTHANAYRGQHVLAQVPHDLKALGWEWVKFESKPVTTTSRSAYTAVYVRPFDRHVDDERVVDVVQFNRQWCVRVSTSQHHSVSWEAAHEEAVALMRAADAKRRYPE
jgi:hypothetical protein